jgi:hypothetical protein
LILLHTLLLNIKAGRAISPAFLFAVADAEKAQIEQNGMVYSEYLFV